MQQLITPQIIDTALTFTQYIDLTKTIIASDNPQGRYADPAMMRYTQSNFERINKALAETVISQRLYNQLSELKEKWVWLVISEPWCGDASWGVPALYLMASSTDNIEFKIILRDEHQDIIAAYPTNGGLSIPKMICLRKSDLTVLGTWGPRPAVLHEQVMKWKNEPDADFKENVRKLHAWFEADMSKTIDKEISALVKDWKEGNNS